MLLLYAINRLSFQKEYKAEGQTDWTADDKAEHHPGELITYRIGMQNFNTAEKQKSEGDRPDKQIVGIPRGHVAAACDK